MPARLVPSPVALAVLAAVLAPRLSHAQAFNNGNLRFGNGTQSSIDGFGNLRQPLYRSPSTGGFSALTIGANPLDIQIGAGNGGGWTASGIVINPPLTGQVIDSSGFVAAGGYGTLVSTGDTTINGYALRVTQTYTLAQGASFVAVTTRLTNPSASVVPNVHLWVGVHDDWVLSVDGPSEAKGRVVNGAFSPVGSSSIVAPAVRVTVGSEGGLLYSAVPGANTSLAACCSFTNATNVNPAVSPAALNGDGSYALYLPVGDLAPGQSLERAWFFAGGSLSTMDAALRGFAVSPGVPSVTAQHTNSRQPVIEGTYDDVINGVITHLRLQVTVDGVVYTEGASSALTVAGGRWTLDLASTAQQLTTGTYDVAVQDTASNGISVVDPTQSELVVDLLPPAAPSVTPLVTNGVTPVITGTFPASDAVRLTVAVNGTTYVLGADSALTSSGDLWRLAVPTLPDGTHDVLVTVTDAAGNRSSDPTTNEVTIDSAPPASPTVTPLFTRATDVTVTGTFDAVDSASLVVTVDHATYTLGVDPLLTASGDAWSLANVIVAEGIFDVVAVVTDAAGNTADDLTLGELTVDRTAPAAPTVVPVLTRLGGPTVTGTYDAASTDVLTVTAAGQTYTLGVGTALSVAGDVWLLNLSGAGLSEGAYDVTATGADAAGNAVSDATRGELVVDQTAPAAPTVTSVAANASPAEVSGTFVSSELGSLTVAVDGATFTLGADRALRSTGDAWSLDLSGRTLTEGVYDVVVTAADGAGNTASDVTVQDVTVDLTAPGAPTVDGLVGNASPAAVTGTFPPSDVSALTVALDGATYALGVDAALTAARGVWTLNLTSTTLAEGVYDVVVTVQDAVGNATSDATRDELVVDLTPPAAPTVDPLVADTPTPLLTGTHDAANLGQGGLSVGVAGVTYTLGDAPALTVSGASWSLDLAGTSPLADGLYDVAVTALDAAGNPATDTTVDELTVRYDADGDGVSDVDEARLGADPASADTDGDGLTDGEERDLNTSLLAADTDGDGVSDALEVSGGLDPRGPDTDGDGLTDGEERDLGTDPTERDTDGDGLTDFEEVAVFETRPDVADTDEDGLSDAEERDLGTVARSADTDRDGLDDGEEEALGTDPTVRDTDGDGVSDGDEWAAGADPLTPADPPAEGTDTDADGIPDGLEVAMGTDPTRPDTDGDGLLDGEELVLGTLPRVPDTDGDGLLDGAEVTLGTDPAVADTDRDGLSDGMETVLGTDPLDADTDGDGLSDGAEVHFTRSDPLDADTDGDGIDDGVERLTTYTNPLTVDTDGDGLTDGDERGGTTAPRLADTDHGGAVDGDEALAGTDGLVPTDDVQGSDADGDGVSDAREFDQGTGPTVTDSDGDGLSDGDEALGGTDPLSQDTDGDGVTDGDEILAGMDPLSPDTDGDGVTDGDEALGGTDAVRRDTDRDGVTDAIEALSGTDAVVYDTDGDGLSDGQERDEGTDPLSPDTDGDGRIDGVEVTTGADPLVADTVDQDLDGDGLSGADEAALGTNPLVRDTDGDGVDDGADPCPLDSPDDLDGDGVCNHVDVCPLDPLDDVDGDGVCDSADLCDGDDATGDTDADGVCDDLDACPADGADGTCLGEDATGCACSATGGAPSPWNVALFGLVLLGVRRREGAHRG